MGDYRSMSLGKVVRLWGAVDYEPDFRFFDKMFSVSSLLRRDFEHWWTDKLSIVLNDYSRRESLSLSSKRVSFEAANPEDLTNSISTLSGHVRRSLEGLGCRTAKRMGLKVIVFADIDLTFDNIKEQMRPLCLPQNDALERVTSSEITDLAMNFDYVWEGENVMLRVGPMKNEQGLRNLLNVGDVGRLFPPPDQNSKFSEFCSSIPESFLYFDIDVFTKEERGVSTWPTFVQEVGAYCGQVFEGIKKLILECE